MPIAIASARQPAAQTARKEMRSGRRRGIRGVRHEASLDAQSPPATNELSRTIILYMRTIDLDSLEIFRTVVAEGGVIRAAGKLNRVQSNITTRIQQLEERLGAQAVPARGPLARAVAGRRGAAALRRAAAAAGRRGRERIPERPAAGHLPPRFARKHGRQPAAAGAVALPQALPGRGGRAGHGHHRRADPARQCVRGRGRLRLGALHRAGPRNAAGVRGRAGAGHRAQRARWSRGRPTWPNRR